MKHILFFILFLLLSVGCKSKKDLNTSIIHSPKKELSVKEIQTWYQKDEVLDGIPGISLDKWYASNKKKPKNKNIIVAIVDTQIDKNHEDLKGQFWTNNKEIPNNGIDDDQNGYIDDTNGWSFTGTKSGSYVVWNRYEFVRIVQEWDNLFRDKTESQIDSKDLWKFKEYQRALKTFEEKNKYYRRWFKSLNYKVKLYPIAKDTLKYFFPKENYTYKQLDSLYKKYKTSDKEFWQRRDDDDKDLGALIGSMIANLDMQQYTLEKIQDQQTQLDSIVHKNLNVNYNERLSIGDNPNILEKGYGNNKISNTIEGVRTIQDHNTMVSGIIAANRNNNIGIKGITDIKIMPLNISPSGDEHDKDIAMAVRYAVDNGAKIINMSFGKEFSMHKDWVSEAFKYAEEHNVLLVHSAGNDSENLDKVFHYPNDQNYEGIRGICNNFISVGSTTKNLGEKLVSDYSNYGKENVDLFAPGEDIYTTGAGNIYKTDSGTSFSAPMVSGTAAIIWSYYPNLTAAQVKQIIMDSGTAYNFEVILPGTKDKKVPFSELSKSGKVLNVYNAMQLAKKIR
ncbi:S8 family peptidase [Flavobacterium sp. SORGH_AS_0622]|uniref:S8 family peptidase n=1 Tax=Flavobacterium sp. SORGH_AS_0622 TaxID=3041772 RepID=UPI002782CBD1|nr:S8 family peptidase [Flavobacterium sp. SORGH_AS_0622]MDQ1164403.1 cell wall-associated protease [Flavobacterium sp. SORGH_AS_0622]